MNIDGNDVRASRIDAITEIEIEVRASEEGAHKFARGHFELLIQGQRIRVSRVKRFNPDGDGTRHGSPAQNEAVRIVREELTAIRESAVAAMGEGG